MSSIRLDSMDTLEKGAGNMELRKLLLIFSISEQRYESVNFLEIL